MAIKHTIRDRHGMLKEVNLTALRAIRKYCVEQCSYSDKEVRLCQVATCALFPYRLGKNPSYKGAKNTHVDFQAGSE